ncbi:MAG: polysaccharide deacetylase family protein [Cyanothece sp. SIO1E1]|nr:polysaccharide deacetylase family protein [Cyanothece sp. SIO1E1]
MNYPRDMQGYGQNPPPANWPNEARIAVQFVINYEEGAERNILHGDDSSESFLADIPGATPVMGARYVGMESLYEYGSRAGFWRLHRLFTRNLIPVTVFGVAQAMQRNPEAVAAMQEANWEIASHGYRWIDYKTVDEATERDHFQKAIALHTELTGEKPRGWYLGRCSERSLQLVKEDGTFTYCSDSYADDLPYWDYSHSKAQLMVLLIS